MLGIMSSKQAKQIRSVLLIVVPAMILSAVVMCVTLKLNNSRISPSGKPFKQQIVFSNTQHIDLGAETAEPHKIQGFENKDFLTEGFATAIDRVTRVKFWSISKDSRQVTLKCRTSNQAQNIQPLIVSVNGKKTAKLDLSKSWNEHTFTIPGELIMRWANVMTLETPKGTIAPDFAFDLDEITFDVSGPKDQQKPVIRRSQDGWLNLMSGYGAVFQQLNNPGTDYYVETHPEDTGIVRVEFHLDTFRSETRYLGGAGWCKRTKAVFTYPSTQDNPDRLLAAQLRIFRKWSNSEKPIRIRVWTDIPGSTSLKQIELPSVPDSSDIILITLDSLRADAIGGYGYPEPVSPIMDQLIRTSIQCLPSLAAAPYTTSSVASLLTAEPPPVHRVFEIGNPIPSDLKTLATTFKDAGYATIAINTMASIDGRYGFNKGFDQFHELFAHGDTIIDAKSAVDKTIDVLNTPVDKPKFIYLHIREPHEPYIPPEPYAKIFSDKSWSYLMEPSFLKKLHTREHIPADEEIIGIRQLYDAGIRYVDSQLGRIIRELIRLKRLEHTYLILISDHGEAFYEHDRFFHNSTVYEEMVRIPMILSPGTKMTEAHRIIDELGTLNLSRHLFKLADPKQLRTVMADDAVGEDFPESHGIGFHGPIALYKPPWKFIGRFKRPNIPQLYLISDDPLEQNNLVKDYPALTRFFQDQLDFRKYPLVPQQPTPMLSDQQRLALESLGYLTE